MRHVVATPNNEIPFDDDLQMELVENHQIDEQKDGINHICYLCERPRPIFLVDSDDMILRLPERFLPPFLKNLKQDFLRKKQYLKFMKISSKFIQGCSCPDKFAHSYCSTAFVLRS